MTDKILVIEDDVEINELLGEYLALEDIAYIPAFDGQSGISKTAAEQPRGVILDLMLPDIDGYEVCRSLATHRATSHIPAVILTCMNQSCDREKALASGAIRFMNKPFLPDDLLATLKEAFVWRDSLPTRPPQGTLAITSGKPESAYRALREMTADLFTHSTLSDQTIGAIWDAFLSLVDWLNRWSAENKRPATLTVNYRLLAAGKLAPLGVNADTVEWIFTEPAAGLLAQTLLKVPTKAEAKVETKTDAAGPWQLLFGKLGVANVEKDTNAQKVTAVRSLVGAEGNGHPQ